MGNNTESAILFIGAVHQLRRRLKEKMNQDVEVRMRYARIDTKVMNACSI